MPAAASCVSTARFLSTLPRGERRQNGRRVKRDDVVSIHAPARGATLEIAATRRWREVSIHAPARGATIARSRPTIRVVVSIHAPARGATRAQIACVLIVCGFYPRSRAGSDRSREAFACAAECFYPRSRAGSDRWLLADRRDCSPVSIHAPARGATRNKADALHIQNLFLSTLPRGERLRPVPIWGYAHAFLSTLPRGERLRHGG